MPRRCGRAAACTASPAPTMGRGAGLTDQTDLMQWTRRLTKWFQKARMISRACEIIHEHRRRVPWHRLTYSGLTSQNRIFTSSEWMTPVKGIINSLVPMALPGVGVGGQSPSLPLHGHGRTRDLPPDLGALSHLSAILGRGEPVVSRTEVLSDGTVPGEKALGVSCRFKPMHPPLSLVARLKRVFRTTVEVAVLAMFHTREIFPFRRPIALQLIGDDHA
jgi:hypothetical protein